MTEYGRGPGSQPWDPDDPLYGDHRESGGQQPGYQEGWNQQPDPEQPYQYADAQQQYQQYQQYGTGGWTAAQHQTGQVADPYGTGEWATGTGEYPTGGYPSGQYPVGPQHTGEYLYPGGQYATGEYPTGEYSTGEYPYGPHHTGEYPAGGYGEYSTGEYLAGPHHTGEYLMHTGAYPVDPQHTGEYQASAYPQSEYPSGEYPSGEYASGEYPVGPQQTGGYPSGEYAVGGYPSGEYATGEHPAGRYATGQHPVSPYPVEEHTGEHAGLYGGPQGGDPSGVPPRQPYPDPQPVPRQASGATVDPETGWDPGPDRGERAFFLDRDDDGPEDGYDDEDDEDSRLGRRRARRGGTGAKRGRGCSLVISAALVAGVGVVGYVGYDFYQSHFAPAPDYEGKGSGEVMVDIPDGVSVSEMGQVLQKEGVVKSAGAFVEAAGDKSIQAGTYTLRKKMSGASAVEMMLDPGSQNGIIVAEGWRASKVYEQVDRKLDVPEGSTKKAADSGDIGLPKWAHGKPEGFLYPSRYSVGKDSTPKDVLRQMVKRAEAEYAKAGLDDQAEKTGKTPEQILTIASLVQAEAQEDHEFGKVSRVIYNRLDKDMALGFDSTINYAKGRSTLDVSVADTKYPSSYNTYLHKGLPPGPISNPGQQAIEAALKPTTGDWLYFVTVKPGDTRFTDDPEEHRKNVEAFNREQREQKK